MNRRHREGVAVKFGDFTPMKTAIGHLLVNLGKTVWSAYCTDNQTKMSV